MSDDKSDRTVYQWPTSREYASSPAGISTNGSLDSVICKINYTKKVAGFRAELSLQTNARCPKRIMCTSLGSKTDKFITHHMSIER